MTLLAMMAALGRERNTVLVNLLEPPGPLAPEKVQQMMDGVGAMLLYVMTNVGRGEKERRF